MKVGDLVNFAGPDSECPGLVIHSFIGNDRRRWYTVQWSPGMRLDYLENELIVAPPGASIPVVG